MNVLLLGYGSIGRRYLPIVRDLGHTVWVHDPALAGSREHVFPDHQLEVLDDCPDDIDATLICTPPSSHIALARWAVTRGHHVFIEKPLTCTGEGMDELVRDVEAAGVVCMVSRNWRYDERMRHLKADLLRNVYGDLPRLQFWMIQPRPAPRAEQVPVLFDSIHELDLAWWLSGPFQPRNGLRAIEGMHAGAVSFNKADLAVYHSSGSTSAVHLWYRDAGRILYERCVVINNEGVYESIGLIPGNAMYVRQIENFCECVRLRAGDESLQDAVAITRFALQVANG